MKVLLDGKELSKGSCPMSGTTDNVLRVKYRIDSVKDVLELESTEEASCSVPLGHALGCPCFLGTPVEEGTSKQIYIACCITPERINPETGEREILITRRHKQMRAFPNIWVFPGGHADKGETLQQAVLRELKEETGIHVQRDIGELQCIAMWESVFPPEPAQGNIKKQHIIFFYSILLEQDEVDQIELCQVEVSAAGWLDREKAAIVLMHNKSRIPIEKEDDSLSLERDKKEEGIEGETFSGLVVEDGKQTKATFDIVQSLCRNDISLGKERISTATSFVLSQWFRNQQ